MHDFLRKNAAAAGHWDCVSAAAVTKYTTTIECVVITRFEKVATTCTLCFAPWHGFRKKGQYMHIPCLILSLLRNPVCVTKGTLAWRTRSATGKVTRPKKDTYTSIHCRCVRIAHTNTSLYINTLWHVRIDWVILHKRVWYHQHWHCHKLELGRRRAIHLHQQAHWPHNHQHVCQMWQRP